MRKIGKVKREYVHSDAISGNCDFTSTLRRCLPIVNWLRNRYVQLDQQMQLLLLVLFTRSDSFFEKNN